MITPVIVGVYPGSFDPLTVAHLAIAEIAVEHLGLDRLELAISHGALGKEHLDDDSIAERTAAIERAAETRPWLGVVVVHTRLIAEIAAGYDAVVMGADKWAQVNDPAWYGGDVRLRDRAVAALPRIGIAPRGDWPVPDTLRLPVPEHLSEVSATAVRDGRHDWLAPEARRRGAGG
jgi:hypothetical protein